MKLPSVLKTKWQLCSHKSLTNWTAKDNKCKRFLPPRCSRSRHCLPRSIGLNDGVATPSHFAGVVALASHVVLPAMSSWFCSSLDCLDSTWLRGMLAWVPPFHGLALSVGVLDHLGSARVGSLLTCRPLYQPATPEEDVPWPPWLVHHWISICFPRVGLVLSVVSYWRSSETWPQLDSLCRKSQWFEHACFWICWQ